MALITWLGIAAGALQALGYVLYVRQALRKENAPNAATWFMFAYGTALLGILEFDREAEWPLLFLPAICATGSCVVAYLCWRRGKLRWPKEWQDGVAFASDIILTALYAGAWGLATFGALSEGQRGDAILMFLICSNLTTLTAFTPLLRGAEQHETPVPWVVWTFAYALLGMATYEQHGFSTELMIYPVLNVMLHGRVAFAAHGR